MEKKHLSSLQIIAIGYFLAILAGTILLLLPISARDGCYSSFTDALFTATSASCVTGLVVKDTASYWSGFGQAVILFLIQLGGLGFMTFATFLSIVLKRKIGLRERTAMNDSINKSTSSGIIKLTKRIIITTLIIEFAGAALLSIRFIKEFGLLGGIWKSVFLSVSSFCNAGFDIMGLAHGSFSSLTYYSGDILVNVVIMSLIIIGGLGFLVWDDLLTNKFSFKKFSLHTKIVLFMSAVLVFGGAFLFYIFEFNSISQLPAKEQILQSFFNSVTPRTAGFNTSDTASLTDGSKLLTMVYMFIGGSPGSTAGGVKTTTILIMILYTLSAYRVKENTTIWNRAIEPDAIKKSIVVCVSNLSAVIIGTLIICGVQSLNLVDVLFETFSAIGTVGMSTGITRDLCLISKYVIIFLMYCGRVGSITFAIALVGKRSKAKVMYPTEKVTIG